MLGGFFYKKFMTAMANDGKEHMFFPREGLANDYFTHTILHIPKIKLYRYIKIWYFKRTVTAAAKELDAPPIS